MRGKGPYISDSISLYAVAIPYVCSILHTRPCHPPHDKVPVLDLARADGDRSAFLGFSFAASGRMPPFAVSFSSRRPTRTRLCSGAIEPTFPNFREESSQRFREESFSGVAPRSRAKRFDVFLPVRLQVDGCLLYACASTPGASCSSSFVAATMAEAACASTRLSNITTAKVSDMEDRNRFSEY